jgi:hypothetical protein
MRSNKTAEHKLINNSRKSLEAYINIVSSNTKLRMTFKSGFYQTFEELNPFQVHDYVNRSRYIIFSLHVSA